MHAERIASGIQRIRYQNLCLIDQRACEQPNVTKVSPKYFEKKSDRSDRRELAV